MIGVVLPPHGLGEPEVQCGDFSVSFPNINACEEPPRNGLVLLRIGTLMSMFLWLS